MARRGMDGLIGIALGRASTSQLYSSRTEHINEHGKPSSRRRSDALASFFLKNLLCHSDIRERQRASQSLVTCETASHVTSICCVRQTQCIAQSSAQHHRGGSCM